MRKAKSNVSKKSQKEVILPLEIDHTERKKLRVYTFVIFALAVLAYILSVANDYALDDFIVIIKNKFTQRGFAGVGDILSKDTFAGMTEDNIMGLSGGRYRPLSVVTFAIEHALFGSNPSISHFINVILNALNCVLLFKLLLKFKTKIISHSWINISFAAALLFVVLPVHSEPVINIKGRDDLMSLMFFLLASLQLFKFISTNKSIHLYISYFWFFLSLLSKEIAITFIAVFPLLLYFFSDSGKSLIRKTSIVYLALGGVFIFLRYMATRNNSGEAELEILNNPFIYASTAERYATVILCSLLYFKLLIFPVQMSYDYNFNQIPIVNFSDPMVMASVIIHLILIVIALIMFKRKSVISFSILFYFITFSIVSNFFFNIGTTIADRFVYIPSIGYCLLIAVLFYSFSERLKSILSKAMLRYVFGGLLVIVSTIYLLRVIDRIPDWKNNNTLFLADVDDAPRSVKVQINASLAYMDYSKDKTVSERDSLLDAAISHLEKAIEIYPSYVNSYINMGVAYRWKMDLENAEFWWNKAREVKPDYSKMSDYLNVLASHYFAKGMKLGSEGKVREAIPEFLHAIKYDSTNTELLFNLGGAYYTISRFDSASYFWNKSLALNPDDQQVKQAILALPGILK